MAMEVIPFDTHAQLKRYRRSLIDVYLSAYSAIPEYAYTNQEEVRHYLGWLFRRSHGGFFVLFSDSQPRGFISTDPEWIDLDQTRIGEIHELAIARDFQGRGAGSLLLSQAIEFLRQKGHRRVGLWVGANNIRAIEFYTRKGFRPGPVRGIWKRMYLQLPQMAEEGGQKLSCPKELC